MENNEVVSNILEDSVQSTLFNLSLTQDFDLSSLVYGHGGSILPPQFWDPLVSPFIQATEKANQIINSFNSSIVSEGVPSAAYKRFRDRDRAKLSREEMKDIAKWMGAAAEKSGLPPELPVMAALTETGDTLRNLLDGDRDSVGFFQIRASQNGSAAVASPEAQLNWFIRTALLSPLGRDGRRNKWTTSFFKQQVASARAKQDSGSLALWLGRWCQDIERSGYPDRYAHRFAAAQELIYGTR